MQHQVEAPKTILSSRNIDPVPARFLTGLFRKEESHPPERYGLEITDVPQRYFLAT
jgi:hypothetical protein